MILSWALMVVLVGAAVLMFIGQRTANPLLWAIALWVMSTIAAVLAAMYGFHHNYWTAAVLVVLAFTQAMAARRKWTQRQAISSE